MRLVTTALLALTIVACGGAAAGQVSRDTFDGGWPLTIESGELRCEPENEVVINAGSDGVYALNGAARGSDSPWLDGYDIMRPGTVPADLGDLITAGLALCT